MTTPLAPELQTNKPYAGSANSYPRIRVSDSASRAVSAMSPLTGNGTLRLEGAARALGSPGKSGSRV